MAHKGRFYPVWFRRDFGINSAVNQPFAQFYRWAVDGIVFTPFNHILTGWTMVENTDKRAGDHRTWTSTPWAEVGLTWGAQFTVTNDPLDGFTHVEVFLDTAELGPMLIMNWDNPGQQFEYTEWQSHQAGHLSFKRSSIGFTGDGGSCQALAVGWLDLP